MLCCILCGGFFPRVLPSYLCHRAGEYILLAEAIDRSIGKGAVSGKLYIDDKRQRWLDTGTVQIHTIPGVIVMMIAPSILLMLHNLISSTSGSTSLWVRVKWPRVAPELAGNVGSIKRGKSPPPDPDQTTLPTLKRDVPILEANVYLYHRHRWTLNAHIHTHSPTSKKDDDDKFYVWFCNAIGFFFNKGSLCAYC